MTIEFDAFLDWVKKRFPSYRSKRGEIKINSIFVDDRKFHLYCNPSKNAYHCWKSGKSGNLIQLVAEFDGIEFDDAARVLGVSSPLRYYNERLEVLFHKESEIKQIPAKIELPEFTFLIEQMSDISPYKKLASAYLEARKIPVNGMYVCTDKKYKDRIIIPYRNRDGALIYWNGRAYRNINDIRYMGPDRDTFGVGKEDVIYFYKWPTSKKDVMLTEGEFDAISLCVAGLCGGACGGKQLFDKQAEYLEDHSVCLAFDNDERGGEALHNVGTKLLKDGKRDLTFVRPPTVFKDWNDMLVARGQEAIQAYVKRYQRFFNQWTSVIAKNK